MRGRWSPGCLGRETELDGLIVFVGPPGAKRVRAVPVTAQRVPVVALRKQGGELFPDGLNQA